MAGSDARHSVDRTAALIPHGYAHLGGPIVPVVPIDYALPPAGIPFQPDPRPPFAAFGSGDDNRRGAASAYGAGLVALPGTFIACMSLCTVLTSNMCHQRLAPPSAYPVHSFITSTTSSAGRYTRPWFVIVIGSARWI